MKPPFLSCSFLPPSPFSSSAADVLSRSAQVPHLVKPLSMSLLRMRVWARSIRLRIPAIVIPRLLLLLPLWRLLPRLSLLSFPASVASVVGATTPLAVVHPAVVRPRCRRWCARRRGCVRQGGHNIVATAAFAAAAASVAVVIPLRAVAFAPSPSVRRASDRGTSSRASDRGTNRGAGPNGLFDVTDLVGP